MDALDSLHRKIESAQDLKSVVRTMKAMAASNIGQYQMAVSSLGDYYHTVVLALIAYLTQKQAGFQEKKELQKKEEKQICAIVIGSDQGLVGQFNDVLAEFVTKSLNALPGKKEIWGVGERVELLLSDTGLPTTKHYNLPGSINGITPFVRQILADTVKSYEENKLKQFYVFHNRPIAQTGYGPVMQLLLPLDKKWRQDITKLHWPTKLPPQVIGIPEQTLLAFIREYLFVSIFKACAESLAAENTSRLESMQRAEKNIGELLDGLSHKYHQLRQSSIDEELFDVVSGFEAMKSGKQRRKIL